MSGCIVVQYHSHIRNAFRRELPMFACGRLELAELRSLQTRPCPKGQAYGSGECYSMNWFGGVKSIVNHDLDRARVSILVYWRTKLYLQTHLFSIYQ